MVDPEFVAELNKLNLKFDPTTGEEMEKIVHDAYALPDSIVQRVHAALKD
jgi:hypothetical protein